MITVSNFKNLIDNIKDTDEAQFLIRPEKDVEDLIEVKDIALEVINNDTYNLDGTIKSMSSIRLIFIGGDVI